MKDQKKDKITEELKVGTGQTIHLNDGIGDLNLLERHVICYSASGLPKEREGGGKIELQWLLSLITRVNYNDNTVAQEGDSQRYSLEK